MLRTILTFGAAAGLVVALPMFLMLAMNPDPGSMSGSHVTGYLLMLAALSLTFVGVKRYRDRVRGGVIKFVPALMVGLGISAVASVIYVIGWEITLAATDFAFAETYTRGAIDAAREKGASAAEIEQITVRMAAFQEQYANPFFRLPVTFIEIFPVGVVISLISAALLRNSRFLPARTA